MCIHVSIYKRARVCVILCLNTEPYLIDPFIRPPPPSCTNASHARGINGDFCSIPGEGASSGDDGQADTTEEAATSTTTRRPLIRPADRRPAVLPPRRQFRPSPDDSTTRRPFLPFRRPSNRTTRKPFGRPSFTSTPEPEASEGAPTEDSEPRLPFVNRDRPFARPAFIPPRRPSTSTTTTEATEAPTDPPTTRPTAAPFSIPELLPILLTTRPQPIEIATTTPTTTPRPIQSDDIANLLLQDAFELPEGQSSPPVRFTPARATPKPIVPVKLSTALPEIPSAVRDQFPLAIDPVLASGKSPASRLHLSCTFIAVCLWAILLRLF